MVEGIKVFFVIEREKQGERIVQNENGCVTLVSGSIFC